MLVLRPKSESVQELEGFCTRLEETVSACLNAVVDIAEETFFTEVQETFAAEGLHGRRWANLSPVTAEERMSLGFPPWHPILYRTGQLLASLTTDAVVERNEHGNGNVTLRIGTQDERFEELQRGRPAPPMPARPMVPEEQADKELLCRRIELEAVRSIDRMAEAIAHA